MSDSEPVQKAHNLFIALGQKAINKAMGCVDMNEGGTKLYGESLNITHTKKATKKKLEVLRKELEKEFYVALIMSNGNVVYRNPEYKTYFIMIGDLIKFIRER